MKNLLFIALLFFYIAACQNAPESKEEASQNIPAMSQKSDSVSEMQQLIQKHPVKRLDTDFSKGRLRKEHSITLNDLQ